MLDDRKIEIHSFAEQNECKFIKKLNSILAFCLVFRLLITKVKILSVIHI